MTSYKRNLLIAFLLATVFAACKDRWEEHMKYSNAALEGTVLDQIAQNPDLSTFYGLLKESGYDTIIASSKAFTVWAPTNEALQGIDQGIVQNPASLRRFVGNHISYQQYFTHRPLSDTSRIETLNGKHIFWGDVKGAILPNTENDQHANILTSNGVIQMLGNALLPKPSSWEFILNSDYGARQAAFLESLQDSVFVPHLAPKIGVDPETGAPVYDTLAGMVPRNLFFERGYDISNEDSLSTFILLTDDAFEAEIEEYRPFFNTGDEDSTINITSLAVVKDLAFRGLYTPEQLPSFLYSKRGVKVTINQADIVHVERTSNGIVYVLNKLELNPKEKLLPIRVQGESVFGSRLPERPALDVSRLSHPDRSNRVDWRRKRVDANSSEVIYDVLAYNHDRSSFHIEYPLKEVYSATFDVYMTTYNDFNDGTPYQQTIAFVDSVANDLPYVDVPAGTYERIHLGRYTVEDFGDLDMFLVGAASTSDDDNPLNLDFVELVPVIE